jgi:hypothetical protein
LTAQFAARGFDTTANISTIVHRAIEDGYEFFGRYIGSPSSWKTMQKPEAEAISAEGGKIISIYETNPTTAGFFTNDEALRDIEAAHNAGQALGQPRLSAFVLTVDFPAVAVNLKSIGNYFSTARTEILSWATPMPYKLVAYGDGTVLAFLLQEGLIEGGYLAGARAWPGSLGFTGATIVQSPPQMLYGLDCDPIAINVEDCGAWSL